MVSEEKNVYLYSKIDVIHNNVLYFIAVKDTNIRRCLTHKLDLHWGLGIRTVYNVRIRYPDKVRWLGIRTKQRSRYPDKQMKCPDTEDYSGSRYPDSSPYNEKLSPDTEAYSDPKVWIQKLLK